MRTLGLILYAVTLIPAFLLASLLRGVESASRELRVWLERWCSGYLPESKDNE